MGAFTGGRALVAGRGGGAELPNAKGSAAPPPPNRDAASDMPVRCGELLVTGRTAGGGTVLVVVLVVVLPKTSLLLLDDPNRSLAEAEFMFRVTTVFFTTGGAGAAVLLEGPDPNSESEPAGALSNRPRD